MKVIKLGDKVRDKITGITGFATSRTEFINGCTQYGITLRLKKGEPITDSTVQEIAVDSQQLEVVGKKKVIKKSDNGGPMRVKTFKRK